MSADAAAARVYEIELLLKAISVDAYMVRLALQREHAKLCNKLGVMS